MSKARSISKISSNSVTSFNTRQGAVTLQSTDISTTLNFSPKAVTTITSLTYSGDDLAVSTTSPLPITINGTDFESGSTVYVDTILPTNAATAISYTGTTQITCTPPAKSAASYNLWIVGPTGKLTVLANGILYSGTPNWSGQNTSLSADASSVNIQLSAAGDTPLVYSLVSGTLPTGVTLNSSGLISGTVTGLTNDTTYSNLVIRANDPQNQDASITINLTLIVQYKISRSLRFNYQADSTDLTRTFTQAGNRKTWTLSMWIKRSTLVATTPEALFGCNIGGSDASWLTLWFVSNNGIRFQNWNNSYMTTDRVFRDPSAWYHIVLAVDTTQSVTANRVRFYVNGFLETYTSTITFGLNDDTLINSANAHYIGKSVFDAKGFNGYMTEIYFVDGQALTPNSFARTDSVTGVWTPKSYTGTYGTNGFYLNFSDNSNTTATTLGKDYSGNGNNWTPNNFSVAAGAGNDSLVDSPTSYGTDTGLGGEVRGNYCVFSTIDTSVNVAVSNGGLDLAGNNSGGRARATMAVSSGKWYFEFLMVNTSNGGSHGFMSTAARSDLTGGGGTTDLGVNADTWGVFTNGTVKNNGANGTSVSAISNGQIGMFALDMDSGKFWYGVNGTWSNSGNPATGANPVYSNLSGYTIAPGIGHGVTTAISYSYNFGQRPFAYTAPSGFKALCTQNLPTPAVVQGDDYFNTVLYTGNGSTQSVTGVGFQPDFTWLKVRSTSGNHFLTNAVLGAGKSLYSNLTNPEDNNQSLFTGFASDGFNLAGGNATVNANGSTFVAWNWKANGAGSSNTAGTITSTVSANTTSGFSVVTYTGTGSAATVGHGLGAAPSMIIVKNRGVTTYWAVYHASLGNTQGIELNDTAAATTQTAYWNSTSPTSTVFTVNTDNRVNASTNTYVAYCFAAIPGYSAFGSYTGNGSTEGPFIYLGFRPRFILLKSSTVAGTNWQINDTARDTYNVANKRLSPSASDAEANTFNFGDILSNGFKIRQIDQTWNSSGSTYIYAAFAENPFKYALAR